MGTNVKAATPMDYPEWVPVAAQHYIRHTEHGFPIRALAREVGVHASTILRQVRRFENRRDDPLIDDVLRALATSHPIETMPSLARVEQEAERILRRLCEPAAVLAVAQGMEKAVVVRDGADGESTRTAVVECEIAQAIALNDWISCSDASSRIARYQITANGRTELRKLMAAAESRAMGFAEAQATFEAKNSTLTEREMSQDGSLRNLRYSLAESPLIGLSRRRGKDGERFLSREMVAAGERLREDFELAQAGPRVAQDWSGFLTAGASTGAKDSGGVDRGPGAARDRVALALGTLGPGLGDVVLRCCCYLEGMEQTEKRLGWSARSGKIVLRIALQRLQRHYEETTGKYGPKIG